MQYDSWAYFDKADDFPEKASVMWYIFNESSACYAGVDHTPCGLEGWAYVGGPLYAGDEDEDPKGWQCRICKKPVPESVKTAALLLLDVP